MTDSSSQVAAPRLDGKTRFKSGGSATWLNGMIGLSAFTLLPNFFPEGDDTVKLLQAAAVFALGFLCVRLAHGL